MSRGKLIVLSLCVLVLTACSAPRLTYERLDWIVGWQLGRYVELDRNQRRQFDALFQSGWDWHRARQLPVYAQDLQALSAQIDRTVSPEDLLEWQRRAESHWDRLVQRVAPQACAIVASLSDDQRDSILRRIDERIDRDRERFVERSEAEVRERAGKRLLRSLERWVGNLGDAQHRQAQIWNQARTLTHEVWIQRRAQWRERLALLLDARGAPGACVDLERLFLRGPADGGLHRPPDAHNLAWRTFLSDFANGLQADQREHLRDELADWREDFQVLAARATPDPVP